MTSRLILAVAASTLATIAVLPLVACGDDTSVGPSEGDASSPDGAPSAEAGHDDGAPPNEAAPPSCSGKVGAPGDRTVTLTSGGITRSFDLHVPAAYDAHKPTPLVFLFHGFTMNASSIATATHFAATADKHGMILAVPSGIGDGFNAGACCGTAQSTNVDDVQFTRDMIAKLGGEYCVDDKRVFATGFSNGGFFSYTLACELADVIAAVAPVSGVIVEPMSACNPARAIPVLHIHGTADIAVPYNGGGVAGFPAVGPTVDLFKTKNGCTGAGSVVYSKDDVSCSSWSPCTAGTDVRLCTVTGGGHQWPGGDQLPYGGSPSPNLIASEAIAEFFEAHPLP